MMLMLDDVLKVSIIAFHKFLVHRDQTCTLPGYSYTGEMLKSEPKDKMEARPHGFGFYERGEKL